VTQYPDSEAFSEAMYYLGRTYADIGATDRAIEQLTRLLRQHPKKDKATHESQLLLAKLTRKPIKEIMAAAAPAPSKGIPPPLPNGKVSPSQLPALLPSVEAPGLPQVITCGLNVSC
jgi:tetratricopeptide (TPR) repeat protein